MKSYIQTLIFIFINFNGIALCEENWDINHPMVIKKNQQWNMFFQGCDFTRKDLFHRISRIQPKLEKEFTPLGDNVFSASDQRLVKQFLANVLKGKLLEAVSAIEVSGYYLSDGKEPSILLYSSLTNSNKNVYSIQTSDCMMMITIKPFIGFSPKKGMPKDDVISILSNGFKLNEKELKSFNWVDYAEVLTPGTIVTNYKTISINDSKSWQEEMIVIVSSNGISFLFPKIEGDIIRASKGIPCDFEWLNKRLFAADGELLDKRFKIVQKGIRKRAVKIKDE